MPSGSGQESKLSKAAYAWTWRLPLIIWQGLFFAGPLAFLVVMSFFVVKNFRMQPALVLDNWINILGRPYFWTAFAYTLLLAFGSAFLCSILAFPASYLLAFRANEITRRWALFLLVIPFFTSYLVRTYAWQILLAENGVINAVLSFAGVGTVTMLNTRFATEVGYMTLCLPLVLILQTFSLSQVDKRLVEAAYNLGSGGLGTIIRVIIPAAKTGLVVAALFAFILSFGDFVSPYYLGGSKSPTLSIMIIDTVKSGQQWPRAAVIAICMIITLVTAAFLAVSYAYRRR